jgi:hypothetical protein
MQSIAVRLNFKIHRVLSRQNLNVWITGAGIARVKRGRSSAAWARATGLVTGCPGLMCCTSLSAGPRPLVRYSTCCHTFGPPELRLICRTAARSNTPRPSPVRIAPNDQAIRSYPRRTLVRGSREDQHQNRRLILLPAPAHGLRVNVLYFGAGNTREGRAAVPRMQMDSPGAEQRRATIG